MTVRAHVLISTKLKRTRGLDNSPKCPTKNFQYIIALNGFFNYLILLSSPPIHDNGHPFSSTLTSREAADQ